MITKYKGFCVLCGAPTTTTHHFLFGKGIRPLAEADGIYANVCDTCHNMGRDSIHGNSVSEKLSKIIGQLAWEKDYIAQNASLPFEGLEEEAREKFRARYGKSWL